MPTVNVLSVSLYYFRLKGLILVCAHNTPTPLVLKHWVANVIGLEKPNENNL